MEGTATQRWRRILGLYEFDLETSGLPDGRLSKRDRARRVRLARAVVAAARRAADAADAMRIDATPMLRLAADIDRSLVEAEAGPTLPESDPAWWHGETVAAARVVADHVDLRDSRPKPPPVSGTVHADPRRAVQDRLLDTAFARAAMELMARTYNNGPGARNKIAAFNGCGGVRWQPNRPTKDAGSKYDFARRQLSALVRCDLAERAGPGKTRRGGFRITSEGLTLLMEKRESERATRR